PAPSFRLRVHRAESLGPKPRVLRQIYAPPALQHHRVQTLEEFHQPVHNRKVERERVTGHWERKHPLLRPEFLEDGQERPAAPASDRLQHFDQSLAAFIERPNALVLEKSALSIDPVPMANRVEREKKGLVVEQVRPGTMHR